MNRSDRIKRFAAAIQQDIVSCPNEQSVEGGEVACWIFGCPTDLGDLLMDHDVPEDLQEEVVGKLRCPRCDNPLEPWQEVGTKYSFEQEHEATVEEALRKHGEELFKFYGFLHKFPLLGAIHPFGKKILQEIWKSRRTSLDKRDWFRARVKREHGFGPTPQELVSDQRYNSSGQPRWYLTDSAEAAVAEVTSENTAWVQHFEVGQLDGLLDLRPWRADDERVLDDEGNYHPSHGLLVVSLVYGDLLTQKQNDVPPHQEDRQLEKRQWKPEYLVTRFVAEAANASGFSGILCGSVRYPEENLVVFDPNWCPKEMGEPVSVKLDEGAMRLRENLFWNQGEVFILPDLPDLPIFGSA